MLWHNSNKMHSVKPFVTCNLFIHVAYFPFLKERYGIASMFILDVTYSQHCVISIFISALLSWPWIISRIILEYSWYKF